MRIDTIDKLIAMLILQQANLPTFQRAVGATPEDLQAVTEDLANLQYLNNYTDLLDANKQAVTKIKQGLFNGTAADIGAFPEFPAAAAPYDLVANALERARKRNQRFKLAAGYTTEIGTALGIENDAPRPPEAVKPTIEVFAAQSNYHFSVVGNRGASNMWEVLILRRGATDWTSAKIATGKSVDVTVQPTTPGSPEQLQTRVQLKKNNENYGDPSDIVYVTVNP